MGCRHIFIRLLFLPLLFHFLLIQNCQCTISTNIPLWHYSLNLFFFFANWKTRMWLIAFNVVVNHMTLTVISFTFLYLIFVLIPFLFFFFFLMFVLSSLLLLLTQHLEYLWLDYILIKIHILRKLKIKLRYLIIVKVIIVQIDIL